MQLTFSEGFIINSKYAYRNTLICLITWNGRRMGFFTKNICRDNPTIFSFIKKSSFRLLKREFFLQAIIGTTLIISRNPCFQNHYLCCFPNSITFNFKAFIICCCSTGRSVIIMGYLIIYTLG